MTAPRVVLVPKTWDPQNTKPETKPYCHDTASNRTAHEQHKRTLKHVREALNKLGAIIKETSSPHEAFSTQDVAMVITVGGDGTLLAASHHCDSRTPILGVNSAPSSSVGFFCGLMAGEHLVDDLQKAINGTLSSIVLARMEVSLNHTTISRRVLNDALFCHACPAATSRYVLQIENHIEQHKSSGLWIGPAAGSTAAQLSAGGKILPLRSKQLQFVARDPYLLTGRLQLARSTIKQNQSMIVYNNMRDAKLFIDGPHFFVDVPFGSTLRFSLSSEPLRVVAISPRRGRSTDERCELGCRQNTNARVR